MSDIDELMIHFCEMGAQSVERYYAISGEGPWRMPEYFMPAFIADRLGNTITSTQETNFSTLIEWNYDARKRRGLSPVEHNDKWHLADQLKGCRVDMVLFEGEELQKPKDHQDFYALVEFKGGWLDADATPGRISDRDKLLMLLAHVDTCPWGIVCGWASKSHYDWQKQLVAQTEDRWFEKEIRLPPELNPLFFCARLFPNSPDNARLQALMNGG